MPATGLRRRAAVRPLEIEERETILAILNRMETAAPALAPWTSDLRVRLTRDSIPAFASSTKVSDEKTAWVIDGGKSLTVSPAFLIADTAAQEQELLRAMGATADEEALHPSDIAFVRDGN